MIKTQQQKVQTLFGDEGDFMEYCFACGQKPPKEKDTRPEIEKQDIYTVYDESSDYFEIICARSHGHARSIYLDIIGDGLEDFVSMSLTIKKHSILKSVVTDNMLSKVVDSYDENVTRELYKAGAYLVEYSSDEQDNYVEKKILLEDVLCENYDEECVYWSIPKSKRVCKKNNKQSKS